MHAAGPGEWEALPPEHELEIRNLVKRFGSVTAVKDVALEVAKGEFVSLLGPSGCGKTTILNIIAGFLQPDSGTVILGGADILHVPPHKRDAAMVFQNYALFPHMTVQDNIAFGLRMRNVPSVEIPRRVRDALELVRLPQLGSRYPRQLSGGQQQRVALARALVVRPRILLLDEPLSNLDARLREEMRVELKEIQQQMGITTLFVTHDIQEAFSLSDHVAVMDAGRIEQVGSPSVIYGSPTTPFVASFLGFSNTLEGRVVQSNGPRLEVRLAAGFSIVCPRRSQRDGDAVSVILRPERGILKSARGVGENWVSGVVARIMYLGSTIQYFVDAGGVRLMLLEQNRGEPTVAPGDTVHVHWAEKDVICL